MASMVDSYRLWIAKIKDEQLGLRAEYSQKIGNWPEGRRVALLPAKGYPHLTAELAVRTWLLVARNDGNRRGQFFRQQLTQAEGGRPCTKLLIPSVARILANDNVETSQ